MNDKTPTVCFAVIILTALSLILIDAYYHDGIYPPTCSESCRGDYLLYRFHCTCLYSVPVEIKEEMCTSTTNFYRNNTFIKSTSFSFGCYDLYTIYGPDWCKDSYACIDGIDTCPTFEVAERYYNSGSDVASMFYCESVNLTFCNCSWMTNNINTYKYT